MIGFEYKYTSVYDIMKNIKLLIEYSTIEYIILVIGIIFIIILVYYIIPFINIYFQFNKKEKLMKKKKDILKLIIIQKDIDAEIEKELNIN